jgi:hypothetical protein
MKSLYRDLIRQPALDGLFQNSYVMIVDLYESTLNMMELLNLNRDAFKNEEKSFDLLFQLCCNAVRTVSII